MRWPIGLAALLFVGTAAADPRVEQARKEGEVVWYTAMNVPDAEALRKPFIERYPTLALTVLRATGEKVRTRILTEARANRFVWGAPVEWVRTLDPVVTSPSQVGISAKAPHPAAARLFVDFLLSREAQAVIQSRGRVPARTDLPTGADAGTLKVHYVDPRLAPQFNQYEKEFRETFGRAP